MTSEESVWVDQLVRAVVSKLTTKFRLSASNQPYIGLPNLLHFEPARPPCWLPEPPAFGLGSHMDIARSTTPNGNVWMLQVVSCLRTPIQEGDGGLTGPTLVHRLASVAQRSSRSGVQVPVDHQHRSCCPKSRIRAKRVELPERC